MNFCSAVIALISIILISFTPPARADSSGPVGTWYLRANGYALTVDITNPSPGVYAGTMINDVGASETLDNVSWNDATRELKFRRVGSTFWQWYFGRVVEGIWVGRFSHDGVSASEPSELTSFAWHFTGWNSNYLDKATVPRVWEILINNNERARLRIDRDDLGLVGRLKVYSTVSAGAAGELLENDLEAITWGGVNLSFTQRLGALSTRIYQATVSGRRISGTYSPGAGVFSGARAAVLTYGLTPKSVSERTAWADLTRLRLFHLMMAENPQPLSRTVTVLNAEGPPMSSTSLPPDRDDNPDAWPQDYTVTELRFDYTLPNPYGGAPIARTTHALLSVPTTPPIGGKYPALLAVNGHSGSAWKMMYPGDEYFWYGEAFARRGFVVLALDISHRPLADRADLYGGYVDGDDPGHGNGTHPAIKAEGFDTDWEEDGERSWDAMRALDYLLTLGNVDPNRVIVSGLSMGGKVTTITGGLDPRLSISIPAGYSPDEGVMRYYGNHPCWEWRHADIREYVEVSDYLALTAPRPLLIQTGKADYTFSPRNPPYSADKQVARRTLAAYEDESALFNLYLHYDQHHYHVGDINPTSLTERSVRVPDVLEPASPGSLDWQTSGATHSIQPTLFDWIAAPGTIVPADFALSSSPEPITVSAGESAAYVLTVSPSGAFSDSLSFVCANLPARARCASSPASLRPDGVNDAQVQITISTTAPSVALMDSNRLEIFLVGLFPVSRHVLPGSWAMVLAAVLVGFVLRWRLRWRVAPLLATILLSVLFWVSCGGGEITSVSRPGTPAGTYQVTITASTGVMDRSTTVALVVR